MTERCEGAAKRSWLNLTLKDMVAPIKSQLEDHATAVFCYCIARERDLCFAVHQDKGDWTWPRKFVYKFNDSVDYWTGDTQIKGTDNPTNQFLPIIRESGWRGTEKRKGDGGGSSIWKVVCEIVVCDKLVCERLSVTKWCRERLCVTKLRVKDCMWKIVCLKICSWKKSGERLCGEKVVRDKAISDKALRVCVKKLCVCDKVVCDKVVCWRVVCDKVVLNKVVCDQCVWKRVCVKQVLVCEWVVCK